MALFNTLTSSSYTGILTSLLATLNLTNYSEFGLIVIAIGVANGWMNPEWLVVIAIALSLSFVVATPLNNIDDRLYSQFRVFWISVLLYKMQLFVKIYRDIRLSSV